MIPLSEGAKTKFDFAALIGVIVSYFKLIPWPEIAAFLACVYTLLRIVEWFLDMRRGRRPRD